MTNRTDENLEEIAIKRDLMRKPQVMLLTTTLVEITGIGDVNDPPFLCVKLAKKLLEDENAFDTFRRTVNTCRRSMGHG